jgi:hypothetical protein
MADEPFTIINVANLTDIHPPHRQHWGDRPIEMDTTPVKLRAETLDPIWWRGRQWAVTAFGIEKLDGTYTIAADRLRENVAEWPWTSQMAMKNWVDVPDFMTAWLVALALHGADTTGARDVIRDTAFSPDAMTPARRRAATQPGGNR